MKTKSFLLFILAALFCACDTIDTLNSKHDTILIFRYINEDYKELILTCDSIRSNDKDPKTAIQNSPKLKRNEPFFKLHYSSFDQYEYSFDICELATEEKLIALHGEYYMFFPYVTLGAYPQSGMRFVRDGKWEQICECNPWSLPVLCDEWSLYSEIRAIEGHALDKITKKKRKEMTIDDIVNGINRIIDEEKLDKYSQVMIY